MKKTAATILMILICTGVIIRMNAQVPQDHKLKVKPYKTWVLPMNITAKKIGPVSLFEVKDSSITICQKLMLPKDNWSSECNTMDIPVYDINIIRVKDKRTVGKVLLIGAALGFGIGYLNATIEDWDFTSCLFFGGVGAGAGVFCGTIIGSVIKIQIPIKANINAYQKKMNKIRKYSLKK